MRRRQLEIRKVPLDDVPGLALVGEVDIAVGKQVEAALDDGIRESAGAFVLDLTELEFLDSSGVSLIMPARPRAPHLRDRGRRRPAHALPLA
jgi:anti-anti-sigma factor